MDLGIYSAIGILGIVLGIIKEVLIIAVLFQGVRLANNFIKKYRQENNLIASEDPKKDEE